MIIGNTEDIHQILEFPATLTYIVGGIGTLNDFDFVDGGYCYILSAVARMTVQLSSKGGQRNCHRIKPA